MNCDTCQSQLCAQLDTAPDAARPAAFSAAAEQHLASCLACREFQHALVVLDEQLTRKASQVALPADFATTVLAGLPPAKPRLSPAEIATRKARYEREYRAAMGMVNWARLFLQAATWLRLASITGLCAGFGWLLAGLLRRFPMSGEWVWTQSFSISTAQVLACGIGLTAFAYGVLVVKRPALLRAKW